MSQGKTYGGRYAVLERVGTGGMAEVYRARDELLGREVAVKVLAERLSRDPSFVERFRREAQSAANLNHPNIVSLYDYGSDDGASYIVMEFIDGRSLSDILAQEGRLMPERAAEITRDVARALDRAHKAGIVHRDVKPGNIMITRTGQTKVTDFGIARAVGGDAEATMTQTGMVIGTAAYLSPEQAQGDPVDARSDVYSLGVVLYETLTGNTPFQGDTPLAIAYKHVRETADRPTVVNPDVPQALEQIVMKALAKHPDNRYRDAGEMAEDLDRYLSGQKVIATPMMADETMVAPAGGTQVIRETDIYEDPSGRRAGAYVAIALVSLLLFGLLAWLIASNLFGGGDPVQVPDVVGMDIERARDEIEEVGLDVSVEEKNSNKPEGEVLKQDPEAGETAEEGDTVLLTVSAGVREVSVPDLRGMSLEEATEALKEAGLKVGEVTTEDDPEAEPDEVLNQSWPPGASVPVKTAVDLVVASGTTTVPSVIGLSQEEAEQQLTEAGFNVDVQTQPDDAEEGTVVAQEPAGGSEAERGSTVVIVVSEGQQEMPDVTGQDADEAQAFLESEYGLSVTQAEETETCVEPPGTVCRQDPEPGTPVSPGDAATLYVQPDGGASAPTMWWAALSLFLGLA
ncbi:MAG: Stk1 family PASTA domain-containing Ser/Thr kinase [Actinomycetota bacterium]